MVKKWLYCFILCVCVCSVTKSCLTLCNPMDCSLPGFYVHGIFQARVLEWVAISFSRGIFLTQGSNLGLPNCRQMLLPSEPPGKSIRPWPNTSFLFWVTVLHTYTQACSLPALVSLAHQLFIHRLITTWFARWLPQDQIACFYSITLKNLFFEV